MTGLGRVATIAIVIATVARLIMLGYGWWTFAELDRARAAGDLSGIDFTAFEVWLVRLGAIQFGSFVIAVIVFLVWLYRARGNAEVMAPGVARLGRGWAIGAWFVPLGGLVLGPMTVADVWRASAPSGTRPANPVLWWGICLPIAGILNYTAPFVRTFTRDSLGLSPSFVFHGIEAIVDLIAAALIVLVILRVSRWQAAGRPAGPKVEEPEVSGP